LLGSTMLEVAIGMSLIFTVLSLICTALREAIESWAKTRAADLERGIRRLLSSPKEKSVIREWVFGHRLDPAATSDDLAQRFYMHPLVQPLHSGTSGPSYIPSSTFVVAVWDIVMTGKSTTGVPELSEFIAVLEKDTSLPAHLRHSLLGLARQAGNDIDKFKALVAQWFDGTMDRVSGWYKRRTQMIVFFLGLGIAVFVNADSIRMADELARDQTRRAALVSTAQGYAASTDQQRAGTADWQKAVNENYSRLERLGLPIGWRDCTAAEWHEAEAQRATSDYWRCSPGSLFAFVSREGIAGDWREWLWRWGVQIWAHLFGWLFTAFAITLGAPFWFDTLNKIMVIRGTVKPHEKSPEEGSEDRQAARTQTVRIQVEGAKPS